jgi:hypothetical protein
MVHQLEAELELQEHTLESPHVIENEIPPNAV